VRVRRESFGQEDYYLDGWSFMPESEHQKHFRNVVLIVVMLEHSKKRCSNLERMSCCEFVSFKLISGRIFHRQVEQIDACRPKEFLFPLLVTMPFHVV